VDVAEYDEMMRRMLAIVVRMDAAIDGQRAINERLTTAIEGIEITQARIETLLARVLRHDADANGREA
jgi:hypothetical protein